MRKTKNKWKTDKCGRCGEAHENYTGKLDANGIEYVICGNTHKRMDVYNNSKIENVFFLTKWHKMENKFAN